MLKMLGIAMMIVVVAVTPVSAFLIGTTRSSPSITVSRNVQPPTNMETATCPLLRRNNYCRGTMTTISKRPATSLRMAVTKSGGRPILSNEQFQKEVLLRADDDHDSGEDAHDEDSSAESPKPILVFYSAPWCGPCRLSNPVVKDIIRQFVPKIDVVEVCTDDLPEIAESVGVVSIPTIQFYYKGGLLDTIVGCVAKNVLSNAVMKIFEDLGLENEIGDDGVVSDLNREVIGD